MQPVLQLSTEVRLVKGIGPRIAESLAEKNIRTVEDLLYHLPFRYEDRLHPRPLADLQAGETASTVAEVRGVFLLRTGKMPILEITVGQGLTTLKCLWFHGTYLQDRFKVGQMLALYGRIEGSRSGRGPLKIIQPQFEVLSEAGESGLSPEAEISALQQQRMLEVGRIVPIYESLGGAKLGPRWIRHTLFRVLAELGRAVPESLPAALLNKIALPTRGDALHQVHFPPEDTPPRELTGFNTPGHRRLIFEELFYLELGLELKRRRMRERQGIGFVTSVAVRNAIKEVLPFHPTAAQKRVFSEIVTDMRQSSPMRRLLQGDVGSGKTIVAFEAAILAMENGHQVALMAPTEILATQHFLVARKLLEKSSRRYQVDLLTGSLDDDRKRSTRGRILRGESNLVIGTHALLEKSVEFDRLGLVIVDEQHRFGVMQRFKLMKKPNAADPDVLVMTATPIPRTLALTLYGDLDISVLDELPPGRTPIHTRLVPDKEQADVWKFLRSEAAAGHQAYIVYPVIEGAPEEHPELDFPADPVSTSVRMGTAALNQKNVRNPERDSPAKDPFRINKSRQGSLDTEAEFSLSAEPLKKAPKPSPPRFPLKSATEMYDQLRNGALKGLKLGLLHGRMSAEEKEITMRRFQRGEIDVLVSTTVIEVGVDVPNATVMVIEHAERFGLAQLHQLRGRVGRGAAASHCILMTGSRFGNAGPAAGLEVAQARLDAMVRTQNGFELAELDLEQRGPGEFFGTRQAGMPDFRVANLVRDRALLELARAEAADFLKTGSGFSPEERTAVMAHLREHWRRRYGLVEA